ncbi:PQQ-binding-like beta-propeller repeat protein [Alkalimonas sp.]|uniref:PQQ-binding-like beta-propeller repeat protein n=1 Tax=Alkalimonas sp. TaxID=1872453 RepID=UPI00263A68B2|nr:PQQ-binding-like beta-propeller repeat protein [Alkalimonas sp.]MCC5827241.1 PQQ-like beta-propeller repeat protein [Alkalimonas sp.]
MQRITHYLLALYLLSHGSLLWAERQSSFKHSTDRNSYIHASMKGWQDEPNWQLRLPGLVVSSPVLAGDTLLLASENGNLYAFNHQTKAIQWIFPTDGALSATPAVYNNKVYQLSLDGTFYAIDLTTGLELWRFNTLGEQRFAGWGYLGIQADKPVRDPWDFFLSSALVHDGVVYFGSSDQHLYALDADTGKLRWAFQTGGMIHSAPALTGDLVLIGSWDGALYALDRHSGEQQWRFQTETEQKLKVWHGIQSSPVVDEDRVYIGSRDGYLYALDLQTGTKQWRYDAERSWIVGTPSFDDHSLYVGTSDTGWLLALDKVTGKERWRHRTYVWTFSSPLVFDGQVVIASMRGDLLLLDSNNGDVLQVYRTDNATEDRYRVLNQESGRFDYRSMVQNDWRHDSYAIMQRILHNGGFLATPTMHNNQLYITSTDGVLLRFAFYEANE